MKAARRTQSRTRRGPAARSQDLNSESRAAGIGPPAAGPGAKGFFRASVFRSGLGAAAPGPARARVRASRVVTSRATRCLQVCVTRMVAAGFSVARRLLVPRRPLVPGPAGHFYAIRSLISIALLEM